MVPRRPVVAALLVLFAVAAVGVPPDLAAAAQPRIAVQSATVTPEQPAPGESFTVTTTVANLQSSSGPVELTDVYVRAASGSPEYGRIEDVGTIPVGGSLSVPLTLRFDEPGERRLTIHAVVRGPNGTYTRVNYPLFVDVAEPDEAVVSFAGLDPVAGQASPINVTVANGDEGPLSNVVLELGGDAAVDDPERVSASLQPGSQRTYTYWVRFPEPGPRTLNATLTYKTSDGKTRSISRDVTADVARATVDTDVTASVVVADGTSAIEVTLTEYGNVELRDIRVSAVANGETVARALGPDVPAESTRTVTLSGRDVPAGNVTIVAEYTAAGERRTTDTTVTYAPAPAAAVALTGVETSRDGDVLTLSGDAANVGTADVRSVLVRVVETEGVTPVAPRREYFVGAIDASEFATFQLTANVSADVVAVPVEIQYVVDGERRSEVVRVDVTAAATGSDPDRRPGWSPWTVGIGIVAIAGLAIAAAVRYRFRER